MNHYRGFKFLSSIFGEEYKTFLNYLIAERKQAGLTQQAVATGLNRPQSFVSKYENGERRLDVVEYLITNGKR